MSALADLIADHLAKWETASVEEGVFFTSDAGAVAAYVEQFCSEQFGTEVASGLFYGSSAGCVAGLELAGGRRVVVKAYQARWGERFLGSVRRVQEHLAGSGFPCPRPLVGPAVIGPASAMAEGFLDDSGMRTLSTGSEMRASATSLATQIETCRKLSEPALVDHPLQVQPGRLYPEPHNPLFDFSLNASAALWIDELAAAAKSVRDADTSPPVIAHTDWSARNIRLVEDHLVAAYDWDSLALVAETVAVGQAAATWRSTGEADDPIAPGPEEVRAYIAAYEESSGRAFSPEHIRASMAAALWVLAYTARCEHAAEAVTGRKVERGRARLAADGPVFLEEVA